MHPASTSSPYPSPPSNSGHPGHTLRRRAESIDSAATAAIFLDSDLQSLEAIHLATAMQVGSQLDFLVAYDSRLLAFAQLAGLPVASP